MDVKQGGGGGVGGGGFDLNVHWTLSGEPMNMSMAPKAKELRQHFRVPIVSRDRGNRREESVRKDVCQS